MYHLIYTAITTSQVTRTKIINLYEYATIKSVSLSFTFKNIRFIRFIYIYITRINFACFSLLHDFTQNFFLRIFQYIYIYTLAHIDSSSLFLLYTPLKPPLSEESTHTRIHTHAYTYIHRRRKTRGIDHPPFPSMETHSSGTAEKIIPPRNPSSPSPPFSPPSPQAHEFHESNQTTIISGVAGPRFGGGGLGRPGGTQHGGRRRKRFHPGSRRFR